MKTSKLVLLFCFAFLTIYTIIQLVAMFWNVPEYTTLTERVFTVIGVEFGALAFIKIAKIKKEQ